MGKPKKHKRGKPKNSRSGCLLCKWFKANGVKGTLNAQTTQEKRGRLKEKDED